MTFTPSRYQQDIFTWIQTGTGSAIVNAVAGSGKTTTLVEAAKLLNGAGGLFVAFNKHIAEELSRRLAGTGMAAMTIHSMSKQTLDKHLGRQTDPNGGYRKWKALADLAFDRAGLPGYMRYDWTKVYQGICAKAMVTLTPVDDLPAIRAMVAHFGIEMPLDEQGRPLDVAQFAAQMPETFAEAEARTRTVGEISFDEMVYWPVQWGLVPTRYAWLFVDECQDLNAMQLAMVMRARADDGRMLFCGDSRQALYGFAGADAASFDTIRTVTRAVDLPLSVNYRCPTSHLALVRDIVPWIEDGPNAIPGEVMHESPENLMKITQPRDLVLCRMTAPLVGACIKMISAQRRARVLGRDIGKDLSGLVDKVSKLNGFRFDQLVAYVNAYREKQVRILMQKDEDEQAIENLNDRIEAIITCAESMQARDLNDFKAQMEALFGDDRDGTYEGVTFSTVHKSKGLEAERVFILMPEKLPLVWKDQQSWQYVQELNIRYVALTRSKSYLCLLGALPVLKASGTPVPPAPSVADAPVPPEAAAEVEQADTPAPRADLLPPLAVVPVSPALAANPFYAQLGPKRRAVVEAVMCLSDSEIDAVLKVLSVVRTVVN